MLDNVRSTRRLAEVAISYAKAGACVGSRHLLFAPHYPIRDFAALVCGVVL